MKQGIVYFTILAVSTAFYACINRTADQNSLLLRDNWAIQSSKDAGETGAVISIYDWQPENGKYSVTVEIDNPSESLAFSVNPKIIKSNSKELVLPVFWEDNYFALLPGEKRTLKVEFMAEDLSGEKPVLGIAGWNIKGTTLELN